MIGSNEGSIVIMPSQAVTTNATAEKYMSFDTKGYDYCNLFILVGTCTTTTAAFTGIEIAESDTVTSASSMTNITALVCSDTTSTSAPNALAAGATQGLGGCLGAFQLDLRARKRYLGVTVSCAAHTNAPQVTGLALLGKASETAETAAAKSLPLQLANTAVVGCMLLVTG
jgi:hypothetical protein